MNVCTRKLMVFACLFFSLCLVGCNSKESSKWDGFTEKNGNLYKEYPQWFDENNEVVYPVDQQDEKWESMDFQKQCESCQIPKEISKALSTEQLLDVVSRYPLIQTICIYDTLEMGVETVAEEQFAALQELINREDIYSVCWKAYQEFDISASYEKDYDDADKESVLYASYIVEYVLSRKEAYEYFDENQRKEIWQKTRDIKKLREEYASSGAWVGEGFDGILLHDEKNPWNIFDASTDDSSSVSVE